MGKGREGYQLFKSKYGRGFDRVIVHMIGGDVCCLASSAVVYLEYGVTQVACPWRYSPGGCCLEKACMLKKTDTMRSLQAHAGTVQWRFGLQ